MNKMHSVSVLVLLFACYFVKFQAASKPIFYEPFDEPFEGRWIVSRNDDYKGVWEYSKSEEHDDYGLLVSKKTRKYAIVKELNEVIEVKNDKIVLQFEVRMQKGLECGGAYLKYLRPQETGWKPEEFDNKSPYSIMFGPDKCGSTDKVHFIFNHKNPKTGKYTEHHLKHPPSVPLDKLSHVYTAVLRYDNRLLILVDGVVKKKVNVLSYEHFDPPVIPPRTIPDPDDKKPEDWDEREKIADPDAKKPDDWDEDAPFEIEDEEAVKPQGWLDDEPQEINDPEASKPEEWDDEEDGEWEAPKVNNPKCEMAPGCGKWKRPMKRNPAYKGKWFAPLINNPDYKGVWNPRHISNPEFFEIEKPDFEPIAAIGIEIWTMQEGILFDNFLITREETIAELYRETTWKPKYRLEKEKQRAEEAAYGSSDLFSRFRRWVFDLLYQMADVSLLEAHRPKIIDYIQKGEEQPNTTIGILMSIIVIILSVFLRLYLGGKRMEETTETETYGDEDVDKTFSNRGSIRENNKAVEKDAPTGPRKRHSRRET